MKPNAPAILLASAALALLTAQAPAPAPAPAAPPAADPVVAQSGAVKITAGEIRKLVEQSDQAIRDQVRKDPSSLAQLVRSEVLRRQLFDEARAKKWDQAPDVAAKAAQAHDAVVTNTYVTSLTQAPADYPPDSEIQTTYEANSARFMVARQLDLAQVFAAIPASAPPGADDAAQKKLRDLRAQLVKPKANFAEAAKASDDKPSAAKGGDLGFLREDQLVPAVKNAVGGLSDNQLSEPVRLPDGWHLFKLLGVKPPTVAPLADVRDNIVRALRQAKAQQNERQLADDMQKKQPVEINEIELTRALQN